MRTQALTPVNKTVIFVTMILIAIAAYYFKSITIAGSIVGILLALLPEKTAELIYTEPCVRSFDTAEFYGICVGVGLVSFLFMLPFCTVETLSIRWDYYVMGCKIGLGLVVGLCLTVKILETYFEEYY